ncbi:MAG: glycerate kinase [Saprospiraceae bacterium]|nr:glycerate kinase [Saprospiraceae bacterium]
MPNILIATDSFKDALTAQEACLAIERGVRTALPNAHTVVFPLGDGGEGTAEILTRHARGRMVETQVKDPLFRDISARYGLSEDGRTAFIEMAQASGLQRLSPSERNPLFTTTYGTGELILDALRCGARHLILCIGGSATHDCGAGMAEALGYTFVDAGGQPVSPTGENLSRIAHMDASALRFDPAEATVEVLCDVVNPLIGPKGAAHIFAPQKGADEQAVLLLEAGARHLAVLMEEELGQKVADLPGAGAAGGLGAGALVFLGARLLPGAETVLHLSGFAEALQQADLVITGEGRLDRQTVEGKLLSGISQLARAAGIPVIALCGAVDTTSRELQQMGITAAFSILSRPASLQEAISNTAFDLEQTAFSVAAARFAMPEGAHPQIKPTTALPLTKREEEIMLLIAKGNSNNQIAGKLFISSQTVSVHRKNIMRKIGVSNVALLIKKCYDAGLLQ